MHFEIKHRWNGSVLWSGEIECAADTSDGIKLGLAIRLAVKARADLTRADLRGADLTDADLTDAVFRDADLRGADLRGAKGVDGYVPLPVSDPRGYHWYSIVIDGERRVRAGCQDYTIPQAREHWLSPSYDGPAEVRETVGFALDWMEKRPMPSVADAA